MQTWESGSPFLVSWVPRCESPRCELPGGDKARGQAAWEYPSALEVTLQVEAALSHHMFCANKSLVRPS